MAKVALALAALFAVLAVISWFLRAPPHNVARLLRRLAATVGIGVLVYLAATGRLHWVFVALGSLFAFLPRLLPLIGYLPVIGRIYKRYRAARSATGGGGSGGKSQVETRYLRMQLNHDTGEIDGRIIAGRFQGRQLTALTIEQLLELRRECLVEDEESARLVEAFLDNVHGDTWREQAGTEAGQQRPPPASGTISREEAYEILGLRPGATNDEILAAHRRLMQKLHPDRGGSDYLAARINRAKEVLLGK